MLQGLYVLLVMVLIRYDKHNNVYEILIDVLIKKTFSNVRYLYVSFGNCSKHSRWGVYHHQPFQPASQLATHRGQFR